MSEATVDSSTETASQPICLIVLGMAGSGKTSVVQRLCNTLYSTETPPYVINLDPACHEVPYPANIDIRDTVKYKEVMKQYGLGPNGAIITSLNLFSTRFDQVMKLIDSRKSQHRYFIVDTPGQIEVFTWSASGSIITETIASSFRTAVIYVMDVARCVNPITFMSNMLYACSILYKTKLPFLIVLNKIDIIDHSFVQNWMQDFDSFQAALEEDTSYSSNLARSLSLVLDKFYQDIKSVGFSAVSGAGLKEFFKAVEEAGLEYDREYRPEYERIRQEAEAATEAAKQREASSSASIKKSDNEEGLITFGTHQSFGEHEDDDDDDDDTDDDQYGNREPKEKKPVNLEDEVADEEEDPEEIRLYLEFIKSLKDAEIK